MMRARRILSVLLGMLLSFSAAGLMLALLLNGCGTSAPLMQLMMEKHAPSAATMLPGEDYAPMATMITGYLAGEVETFQYAQETADGVTLLFHDYEQQHMADCRGLFRLCRAVLLTCAGMVAVLAVALAALRGGRQAAKGCAAGTGLVMVCVGAVAVWAAVDFSGPFILFHRVSFSNGLWMLNPATDLLIRLMPLDFFVNYVVIIGAIWGVGLMIMLLVAIRLAKRLKS